MRATSGLCGIWMSGGAEPARQHRCSRSSTSAPPEGRVVMTRLGGRVDKKISAPEVISSHSIWEYTSQRSNQQSMEFVKGQPA